MIYRSLSKKGELTIPSEYSNLLEFYTKQSISITMEHGNIVVRKFDFSFCNHHDALELIPNIGNIRYADAQGRFTVPICYVKLLRYANKLHRYNRMKFVVTFEKGAIVYTLVN